MARTGKHGLRANKGSKGRKASTGSSRKKTAKGRTAKKAKTNIQPVGKSDLDQPKSSESAGFLGEKSLESFFPSLAALPSVRTTLRREFGKRAPGILAKMKAGVSLSDEEGGPEDTIHDLIHNNPVVVESLEGLSSAYDETFPINIVRFGKVFWIDAMEFDDVGYFDTLQKAKDAAEFNYEPFITAAKEEKSTRSNC